MKKGTKHSEETRRRMSEAHSGEKHHMYGKHHSQEARRKIVLARAKQVITEDSKKKRSETLKGRKFSKETKEKMRQHALKRFADKKNHPNFSKHLSQETKEKMRQKRFIQIFPVKDTKIELKIQDFLTALKIEFLTHKYMNIKSSYQCDILIPQQKGIPQKTIIECDGDFFHCNPNKYSEDYIRFPNSKEKITAKEIWKRDDDRTKELLQKGFKVLRLWEFKIKDMNLNDFKQKIK